MNAEESRLSGSIVKPTCRGGQENGLRLERRESRPNARELEKILILSEHDVRVQP